MRRSRLRPGRIHRRLDVVRVVGQDQQTELFELLDHRTGQWNGHLDEALATYAEGLRLYVAGNWFEAAPVFEQALAFNTGDKAAALLAARCRHFVRNPPEAWDGAYSLTSK